MKSVKGNKKELEDEERRRKMAKWGIFSLAQTVDHFFKVSMEIPPYCSKGDFFLRAPSEDLFHMKSVKENKKEVEDEERRRRKMAKWGIFSLAETLLITLSKSLWKFPIQK